MVLKVFRYHWGNWALVEIALHFRLELVIYKLHIMFTYWWYSYPMRLKGGYQMQMNNPNDEEL